MWDIKDKRYRLRNERETENQIQKKRRKIKSEKEEEKKIYNTGKSESSKEFRN